MRQFALSLNQPTDLLETTIVDAIRQSTASVRLFNAIVKAHNDLPFETVGEYLAAGRAAKEKFLTIPNLGRRSADELDEIMQAFIVNGPPVPLSSLVQKVSAIDSVRHLLISMFSNVNFPDVILEGSVSARLGNALRSNLQLASPLSEFLAEFEVKCRELQGAGNLGRVSIAELKELLKALIADDLRCVGVSDATILCAHSVIFERQITSDEALHKLQAAVADAKAAPTSEGFVQTRSANEIVSEIMSQLDERGRSILLRRYGFLSGRTETLEEIASDFRLTRERIRQIEAKDLKKIRRSKLARSLRVAFDSEIGERLLAATAERGYIKDGEQIQTIRELLPVDRFAIDLFFEDRDKFLSQSAKRCDGGWLLSPLMEEDFQGISKEVKARLASVCLPVFLGELAGALPEKIVRAAVELGTELSVREGYIIAGKVGVRRLRTIRLHQCLKATSDILEISELMVRYHRSVLTDKQSAVRDATIVMLAAPHLFLGVFDRHWYGLGIASHVIEAVRETEDLVEATPDEVVPLRVEEDGIRKVLRQTLLERGPLRFVELRERAARQMRGKSHHSIGPILITSGEFVRPLPGVYAVEHQIPTASIILYNPPSYLLTDDQARYLAEARFAGEPFGRYLMWGPEAEYALCCWAQAKGDPLVFQSLLAVASIDLWPVSPDERAHWKTMQRTHARYCLQVPQRYLVESLWPPLDRVLAACIVARQNNGLNWMSANRVLKRRLDAHVSPGLLALLVSLGALEAPSQWQMFHRADQNLKVIIQELSDSLHRHGDLDWGSAAGRRLISRMSTLRRSSGWVDAKSIEGLITAAGHPTSTDLPTIGEADESTSSLDDLLREAAELKGAEEAQETMRGVLSRR